MAPPNLNYTPNPIVTETFRVIDSCEPPRPVCSAPEAMVIHDEERGMSYVGIGRRCVEEFHRIPGVNLFRKAPQALPPARTPQNAGSQAPSASAPVPPHAPQAHPSAASIAQRALGGAVAMVSALPLATFGAFAGAAACGLGRRLRPGGMPPLGRFPVPNPR